MNENLKDILSHLSTELDQETLLLYLQGKLSAEKQHQIEKDVLGNEFDADALEGLQDFKDQQKIQLFVDQLNRDLRKKTATKKALKEKLKPETEPWLLAGVLIILILIILSYFIIHSILQQS